MTYSQWEMSDTRPQRASRFLQVSRW